MLRSLAQIKINLVDLRRGYGSGLAGRFNGINFEEMRRSGVIGHGAALAFIMVFFGRAG